MKRIYVIELILSHAYLPLSVLFSEKNNLNQAIQRTSSRKEIAVGCKSPPIGMHPCGRCIELVWSLCLLCLPVSHTAGKEGCTSLPKGPQAYIPHHGVAKHRLEEVGQMLFLLHVPMLLTFSFWLEHRYGASPNLENADLASPRGGASGDFSPEGTIEAMGPVYNLSNPALILPELTLLLQGEEAGGLAAGQSPKQCTPLLTTRPTSAAHGYSMQHEPIVPKRDHLLTTQALT